MIQMNDFVLMMLLSVVFKQREQVLYTFDYEFDVIAQTKTNKVCVIRI